MATEVEFAEALEGGWRIQSSAVVPEDGGRLSSPEYEPEGWGPARVPSTVVPVLWDENCVSLLPGETRFVEARLPARELDGEAVRLVVTGLNLQAED